MPQDVSAKTLADYVRARVPAIKDQPDHILIKYLFDRQPEFKKDTRLASAEEASRMAFESNLPPGHQVDMSKRGGLGEAQDAMMREAALKGMEGVGVDLQSPIIGTAKNLGKTAAKMISPFGSAEIAKGAVQGATQGPVHGYEAIQEKDPLKFAGAVGETITGTLPAIYGATKGVQGIAEAAPHIRYEGGQAVKAALKGSESTLLKNLAEGENALPGAGTVTKNITAPRLNNLIEIPQKWFGINIDPARRLIKDKIVAWSEGTIDDTAASGSLYGKMQKRLEEIGPQLENELSMSDPAARIDANPIIDSAIENARKDIDLTTVEGFEKALDKLKSGLEQYAKDELGTTLDNLTPLQVQRLKSHLGKTTQWRGIPAEKGLNQARIQMYGGLRDTLVGEHGVTPGAKTLLDQWGDYEVGTKSLAEKLDRKKFGKESSVAQRERLKVLGVPVPTSTPFRTGAGRLFRPGPPKELRAPATNLPEAPSLVHTRFSNRDTVTGEILMSTPELDRVKSMGESAAQRSDVQSISDALSGHMAQNVNKAFDAIDRGKRTDQIVEGVLNETKRVNAVKAQRIDTGFKDKFASDIDRASQATTASQDLAASKLKVAGEELTQRTQDARQREIARKVDLQRIGQSIKGEQERLLREGIDQADAVAGGMRPARSLEGPTPLSHPTEQYGSEVPPSPMLDRVTAGVPLDQIPLTDKRTFDVIARDAERVVKEQGFDPFDGVESVVGGSDIRARMMARPEGRNLIAGLVNAMKRQSAKDVMFYTTRLRQAAERESKRALPPRID